MYSFLFVLLLQIIVCASSAEAAIVGPVTAGERLWAVSNRSASAIDDIEAAALLLEEHGSAHDALVQSRLDIMDSVVDIILDKVSKVPPGTKILYQSDVPVVLSAADDGTEYFLGESLTSSTSEVITLSGASNITINLNGFSLIGGSSSFRVVNIGGGENITIKNGFITGGSRCVETSNTIGVLLQDLSMGDSDNDCVFIGGGMKILIEDCIIGPSTFGFGDGLAIQNSAADGVIRNCEMFGNPNFGMSFFVGAQRWIVKDSKMHSNGNGIMCSTTGGIAAGKDILIRNCVVSRNTTTGIDIDIERGLVEGCEVFDNGTRGIRLSADSTHCKVVGNIVVRNGVGIVQDGADNAVLGNLVSENGTNFTGAVPIDPLLINVGPAAIAGSNGWLNIVP